MQGGVACVEEEGSRLQMGHQQGAGHTHIQRNIIAPVIHSYSFRDQYKRSLARSPSSASSSTPLLCDSSFRHPHFRCFFFFCSFTNLALFFHFCPGVIVAAGVPSFTFCCTLQAQDLTPIVQTSGKEMRSAIFAVGPYKNSRLCCDPVFSSSISKVTNAARVASMKSQKIGFTKLQKKTESKRNAI